MKGEPVGWVREWHPDSGWATVPGTESFSSPNGVLVSDDGSHVFVAPSTSLSVFRVERGVEGPEVVEAKVDGVPDNIRWAPDGKSMFAGVHTEDPKKFLNARMKSMQNGGAMFTSFNITRIDAETMETEVLMPSEVYGAFGAATGAIKVGDRLWLSSTKSDRIAIFDFNP